MIWTPELTEGEKAKVGKEWRIENTKKQNKNLHEESSKGTPHSGRLWHFLGMFSGQVFMEVLRYSALCFEKGLDTKTSGHKGWTERHLFTFFDDDRINFLEGHCVLTKHRLRLHWMCACLPRVKWHTWTNSRIFYYQKVGTFWTKEVHGGRSFMVEGVCIPCIPHLVAISNICYNEHFVSNACLLLPIQQD